MDLSKIEHILRKLNKLVEAIGREEGGPTMIERDLYRSYLTQLYDTSFSGDLAPKEEEEPVIIFPEEAYSEPEQKEFQPESDIVKTKPGSVEQVTESLSFEGERPNEQIDAVADIPEKIMDLFTMKEAVEISDRLSRQPVHDIAKSLSINGKLVVINQLFGGNDDLFRSAVDKINQMGSFDEAKDYLIREFAIKNEWGSDDKSEVAEDFIRLLNRKFEK